MSEPEILDTLRGVRFLEGLGDAELRQIASVAHLVTFQPGAVIFREGVPMPNVFLVVEGSVGLEIPVPGQGGKRIHTIGGGELLGWSPLLDQQPMTATARALTATRLVAINAAQVLAMCHHDPKFGFTLMRRTAAALALRLNATRLQLLDVYRTELPPVLAVHEGAD